MKKLLNLTLAFSVCAMALTSCDKEENQVVYEGGTAPALTASSTTALVLTVPNANTQAISFSWTNPNYRFNTGVSSQDVTYTLQFDTVGANFTNPRIGEKAITKDLSVSFTQKELNAVLLGMELKEGMAHNMEIRVKSALAGGNGALYSNVIRMTITPYLDVKYPVPSALWITGSATPLSWQCGCPSDNPNNAQKFTQTNAYTFELTLPLSADNSYLLLPQYGDWSHKYGFDGANNMNNVSGDNFIPDSGGDIKAPATLGNYKIVVNFKTGKFTVTPA